MSGQTSSAAEEQETEELTQFREAWKAELKLKKPDQASTGLQSHSSDVQLGSSTQTVAGDQTLNRSASISSTQLGTSLTSAVEVYGRAVNLEQRSQYDDALRLYRQAFRMDPGVDRAYHLQEKAAALSASNAEPIRLFARTPADSVVANDLSRQMLSLSISAKNKMGGGAGAIISENIGGILKNFPNDLAFGPENEREPVLLQTLPDELLTLILRNLDPTSIERFAAACRKARVLSLDSTIWREIVETTYAPPQVSDSAFLSEVIGLYMSDFRRLYVEHPRIRTDGVYIAFCHYVRQGLSENSWVNISHHVTYHRYLRFYPNGQVLSLLTNEDHTPPNIIPLLEPTLRMKGLFIGTWSLTGTAVHIQNLVDASDKHAPHFAGGALTTTDTSLRYSYQMILEIRSRPLGRWNRLQIICYDSVELGSGEIVPIALKHERPLWFSKVRSYDS